MEEEFGYCVTTGEEVDEIIEEIENSTSSKVLVDEPMSLHTSFKIGGVADYFVKVNSVVDLKTIIKIAKKHGLETLVIGNGTNLLVKDGGFRGIVIKIDFNSISHKKQEDGTYLVTAYSGDTVNEFCKYVSEQGLGDISKIYGIPGTIGGGIRMNAGAYGLEMKDIVYSTTFLDSEGEVQEINNEEHNFGYRTSIFKFNNGIILSTTFKLEKVDKEQQLKNMAETMQKRITNQPLDYPNAGSIFKRGADFIVSKMIDECGLKGLSSGGAEVSTKHAGFIINKDNATAQDVLNLVEKVKKEVKKQEGKNIELEIIVVGEE